MLYIILYYIILYYIILYYIILYYIILSQSYETTVVYAVNRWPNRRYAAHTCLLLHLLMDLFTQFNKTECKFCFKHRIV